MKSDGGDLLTTTLNDHQQSNKHQHESESESSKVKIALMQKQLQHLTDLVQTALVNRDFTQLAAVAATTTQLNNLNPTKTASNKETRLDLLNKKTNSMKSDLVSLKKMQEEFSSTFGDSIKSFVTQLNVSLIH